MRFDLDMAALDALPPQERKRALAALRSINTDIRASPLWRFDPLAPAGMDQPHLKQHAWLLAHTHGGKRVKTRLFIGGNRAGKTTSGVVADIIDLCDESAVPPHLRRYKSWHQPLKMFLVAKNARTAETITLPKLREWVPKDQLVGGRWDRAYSKELGRLSFRNESWLQVMTQSMEVEAFAGADLHRVHFDEEPLYDHGRAIYSECVARLIDHNGDLLITMTPQSGMTWLFDDLYAPWEEATKGEDEGFVDLGDRGVMYASVVNIDDNPTLSEDGKRAAMAAFGTDEERQARGAGRFVSFSGKIYDGFSRSKHIVPDAEALAVAQSPDAQRRLVGLDPGFRHQAGAVWVTLDHRGVWVIGELALQETVIDQVAAAVLGKTQELGVRVDAHVADPAIARRDHQTGLSDREAYAKAGVKCALGQNDVRPGINRIRALIAADRLFVAAGCTELVKQFARYRWVTPRRTEHDPRPAPVKKDDHLLDALRYAIMALPESILPVEPDTRSSSQRLIAADIARARKGGGRVASDMGDFFS